MDIALIIPCYNQAEYLQQLLSDIENQTDKDFYVVLVNDGSTDNTLDVCREFQIKSGIAVDVLTNDKNRGLSAARNYGLDFVVTSSPTCRGGSFLFNQSYTLFFDSDAVVVQASPVCPTVGVFLWLCENYSHTFFFDVNGCIFISVVVGSTDWAVPLSN